ncbi:MAG TPA: ABC transporter permease [Lachnospiraceae bacterium]|jgi:simple sugar transport system permease protein|nr:ABC transporter permease [Lachnospiraceae bacterium]
MNVKNLFKRTETYILIALLLFCFLVQACSGQFFTGNNLVDDARALTILAMFALGEMIVMVSGGIDVSFPAIAALSMYLVSTKMYDFHGNIIIFFLAGALLGFIMGALNGFLIGRFHFIPLIVTLGTSSLYTGIMQGVFASHESVLPQTMLDFGNAKLFSVYNPKSKLNSNMPVSFLFLLALIVLVWFLLRHTKLGRGIYAIGGDMNSARRAGFNVFHIQMFIYCFCGALAGFVGVTRACMMLDCDPTNMVGMDMTCIAACVLGGISLSGGSGTITGTLIGVTFLSIMSNSLILIGVSTYWEKVFTGLIIIIGTGISAYQVTRKNSKTVSNALN